MEKINHTNLTKRQKIAASIMSLVIALAFSAAVLILIGKPLVNFVSDPQQFRAWVDARGILGRLAFIAMVIIQTVIAIIPGEPFEIGAGYAFGAVEGTLLCVIGTTLGSMIIFALVRTIGIKFVEIFFPIEKIHSLKFLQNSKRLSTITFLIFLIPGTPKDLIAYFIGLTKIKLGVWILIVSIARLPSIITSVVGGNALGGEKYITAIIVLGVTLVVSVTGLIIYNFITKRKGE